MNEELAAFQSEVRDAFADMRQEFAAVRAEMRQGFTAVRTEMQRDAAAMERRLDSLEERGRHDGVILEAVRDDVRQLAEAHVLLDQRVERYRRENDDAHQEILVFLRTTYRDVDRRVRRLEERPSEGGPRP